MTKCTFCQKDIEKDQEFILEGKFPGMLRELWQEFKGDMAMNFLPEYGKIYHKDCYLNQGKN